MKRFSRQREVILEILRSTKLHPNAKIIYEQAQRVIPNISLGTVYRNLGQLKDEGFITVVESSDTKVHYEGNLSDHIHFLCKMCHNITDIFCETKIPSALTDMGHKVQSQKTVYYGVCKDCRDNIN